MEITSLILTFNEEPNIQRTLDSIKWIKNIVVIDSFSSDRTLEILKEYSNVKVFQRKFDNHTNQWNFGIEQVKTDWIISMDADYVVPQKLKDELNSIHLENSKYVAYYIPFKYCVDGKPLRATILPPRVAFFDKKFSSYVQDGHTQLLNTNGNIGEVKNHFFHDDRKPLTRWLWAQERYAKLEVEKLHKKKNKLSFADKIRKRKYLAPSPPQSPSSRSAADPSSRL